MFCAQVVIASLGAARIHRGLVEFPALNCSAKTTHGTDRAGEHNHEPVSPQSWRKMRSHDRGEVVLNAPPVTACSTEVHKAETFEGGNIV